jgi:hypothetical protein
VLHLKSGFDKYVLPQHISPFAKVTVSAISARFYKPRALPTSFAWSFWYSRRFA